MGEVRGCAIIRMVMVTSTKAIGKTANAKAKAACSTTTGAPTKANGRQTHGMVGGLCTSRTRISMRETLTTG